MNRRILGILLALVLLGSAGCGGASGSSAASAQETLRKYGSNYRADMETPEDGHVSLCDLATHLVDRIAPAPLEADMRTLPLRHADYDRVDTFIFDGLNSRSVDLVHRETGHGIRLSFDMPVLAVWTMPGKNAPYVCLEPWTGCGTLATEGDVFEQKKGMRSLAPSGKESYAFTIRFL